MQAEETTGSDELQSHECYDERGRLVGENVWEYDETEHDLLKLASDEVLTTQQAAELLEPYFRCCRRSTTACCLPLTYATGSAETFTPGLAMHRVPKTKSAGLF